mgnify:CR=1 FL=1
MNSSEAAEQMVKFSIEGIEMLLRVSGTGAERIAVMLYTMSKDKQMTKGKTSLNKMLKSGSPLQIFSVKASELKKFEKEAKKYGILYTALIDKNIPVVNLINPNNLITDGFYSLYYYDTLNRYFRDVCFLLIFVLIAFVVSFASLRREKYDSI